jgi:hypothetical protein
MLTDATENMDDNLEKIKID